MPIALDPEQTFDVQLDGGGPTFTFHFLTCRARMVAADTISKAYEAKEFKREMELVHQAIGLGLVGWRDLVGRNGVPIPFGDSRLLFDALTEFELWELAKLMLQKSRLSEIDRKKSAPPSPTGTAASAAPVVQANA